MSEKEYMADVILIAVSSIERLRLKGYISSDFGGSPLTEKGHAKAIEARARRPKIALEDIRAALAAANGKYVKIDDVEAFAKAVDQELRGTLPDALGGKA